MVEVKVILHTTNARRLLKSPSNGVYEDEGGGEAISIAKWRTWVSYPACSNIQMPYLYITCGYLRPVRDPRQCFPIRQMLGQAKTLLERSGTASPRHMIGSYVAASPAHITLSATKNLPNDLQASSLGHQNASAQGMFTLMDIDGRVSASEVIFFRIFRSRALNLAAVNSHKFPEMFYFPKHRRRM